MNLVYAIVFSFCMSASVHANPVGEVLKHPLSYSLREYGLVLAISVLGGVVQWILAVRRGDTAMYNITGLIGGVTTAAFMGLLAFYICEWQSVPPILMPAIAGMAGYMGGNGLKWLEGLGKLIVERRLKQFGWIDPTKPAPLQKEDNDGTR